MTALPALVITLNGTRLTEEARVRLTLLRVSQAASAPSLAELTWAIEETLPGVGPGDELSIRVEDEALFEGVVRASELTRGPDGQLFRVRAYDALDRLRQQSQTDPHEAMPLEQFARVQTEGLNLELAGFEAAATNGYMFSRGRSRLSQLRDVAEELGYYFHLDRRVLRGFKLEPAPEPLAASGQRAPLAPDAISGGTPPRTRRPEVHWRQLENAKLTTTRVGTAPRIRVLGSALAQADHFDVESGAGEEGVTLTGQDLVSRQHAEARAAAMAATAQASARQLSASLLPGNPSLRPGQTLSVKGVPGTTAGLAVVLTEVIHTLDPRRGFITDVSSQPPAPNTSRGETNRLSVGEVVELADDGRVRVFFPDYQERSDWLRVVAPGAGTDRGFVMLPERGDHVVVLFPNGDPSHGVVLGGVWQSGPRDAGVADAHRRRSEWGNPKQRLTMDEDDESLTAETGYGAVVRLRHRDISVRAAHGQLTLTDGRGSGFELKGDQVRLYSSQPLTIESPGQPLRIRAARIDFEEA